jgi:hypothetical protein
MSRTLDEDFAEMRHPAGVGKPRQVYPDSIYIPGVKKHGILAPQLTFARPVRKSSYRHHIERISPQRLMRIPLLLILLALPALSVCAADADRAAARLAGICRQRITGFQPVPVAWRTVHRDSPSLRATRTVKMP